MSQQLLTTRDDLRNVSGPGVLAWSYGDTDPACLTVYTVYVGHPGGRPRLQFRFADGSHMQTVVEEPERFGEWDTPRKFAQWARRWKEGIVTQRNSKPLTS